VLAVDLPGHGRSGGPPLAGIEAMADWALRVLDAAGLGETAVVGHSMGSLVALEMAARARGRVSRLVMVGTAYPMKVSDTLLALARSNPLAAIDMVNALSFSTLAAKPSYPGPGMWLHGSSRMLMRRMQAQAQARLGINLFEHDFRACDAYAAGAEAMARVTCPATLVLGARDQMTSTRVAREMAAALKARVVTLPAGHQLMAEAPDGVLQALRTALG
jgi:pimeloyl-ACP methyl ester carboxylesterase